MMEMDALKEDTKENDVGEQQPQPYPQPAYQPYPPPQTPPKKDKNLPDVFLKNHILVGAAIIVAVFLIWLGTVHEAAAVASYLSSGMVIYNLGISLLSLILLFMGMGRRDYPEWVRFALILAAAILLSFGIKGYVAVR